MDGGRENKAGGALETELCVGYKLPVFCFRETIPELIQAWMASGDRGRRGKGKREPRRTDSLFFPFRLV